MNYDPTVLEVTLKRRLHRSYPYIRRAWSVFLCGFCATLHAQLPRAMPLPAVGASSNSTAGDQGPARVIDGVITEESSWISVSGVSPVWLDVQLEGVHTLAGLHLYNGFDPATTIKDLVVQFRYDGRWVEIPSARVSGNRQVALGVAFDDTMAVTTDRLRLLVTATHDGQARIKEVFLWPAGTGGMPPIVSADKVATPDTAIPRIYLNQSGFNLGEPKRFTAPTLPDKTRFEIESARGGPVLFSGEVRGNIGDFSAFDPVSEDEFVVVAGSERSVPFRIGMWWLERVTYQRAIDFMVDSRHYVGNWRAACRGSFAWRDDHHFGWELHTLVPQYLSNPSAYARMPRQVRYEAPTEKSLWGALEPYRDDAPDLVKMIHWGADVIVTQRLGHEHLKAQLAYFLYAWPWLREFLPEQNYEAVREYTFIAWSQPKADRQYPYDESPEHDLLALKTKVGTTKGAYPPGFSVQPNLLLFEVARREHRADAELYFEAAHRQAAWMIANVDWDDPQSTKGQRMSEFLTATGLAHFLREYPDRAPAGLREKLESWASVVIRRSENLWDFRKLTDGPEWVPTGPQRTMWNEPGNVLGLPAALLAVQPLLGDVAKRARIDELVYAHFDNGFGRNPTGRHFSYDAPRELEGVEHGWYSFHHGGIGQLSEVRFVVDGSPKRQHYPYHPEQGNVGWTEGWVQFNAAFNHSLAWLAYANTRVTLRREGDHLIAQLVAPLNFDYQRVESARVRVAAGDDVEWLNVDEDGANARTFSGRIPWHRGTPSRAGDGKLQGEGSVEAQYGFGYLARRAVLIPERTSATERKR